MFIKSLLINIVIVVMLTGCQEDLLPESESQESGPGQVNETVDDFSTQLNTGDGFVLNQRLSQADAVVFYFTMWCTACAGHTSIIKNDFETEYANVDFVLVDYVSSTTAYSRSQQQNEGFTSFDVIADTDNQLEDALSGTMGSIVVIDTNYKVLMNETFNNSAKLKVVLDQL